MKYERMNNLLKMYCVCTNRVHTDNEIQEKKKSTYERSLVTDHTYHIYILYGTSIANDKMHVHAQ